MAEQKKSFMKMLRSQTLEINETYESLSEVIGEYRKFVFKAEQRFIPGKANTEAEAKIHHKILEWALQNQIQHYSFLSFPYNSAMCEKQESFIDIKYVYDKIFKGEPRLYISPDLLLKGEADGSSFPSGGLRVTHQARAYTLWDQSTEIFIRKNNKVMYIPSLLVTHYGDALDDITIFKKSEIVLKESVSNLLNIMGVKHKDIIMCLGLEQQFFVIKKEDYLKRQDLRYTGRTLVGNVGERNQKFSDHYVGKIPHEIEAVLTKVQHQLLEIGIPFKTRHNQVANNQFQFCTMYEQAGKSIFHNLITMQILKEAFDKQGYTVLLNEKPFQEINGSGKHANWSIQYIDEEDKIKNLFSVPKGEKDTQLFKLFILMNLTAIKNNNSLYFAAISTPGNQIRLGGHEAPPRIISAYLGQTISAILDNTELPKIQNLRDKLFNLHYDVYQEETDRNRTSPYAYTGHKFEFRALGSSQNASFPMAVIAATLAKQAKNVAQRLKKGENIQTIIADLRQQSRSVQFQGNGYSKQWAVQAKTRGLYENLEFREIFERVKEDVKVFVQVGACNAAQIGARCEAMKEIYVTTVETQAKTLLTIAKKHILPPSFRYLQDLKVTNPSEMVAKYIQKFEKNLQDSLASVETLEGFVSKAVTFNEAYEVRAFIKKCGSSLSELLKYQKRNEDFPNLSEILLL